MRSTRLMCFKLADLPKKCYIFLDVVNYPPVDGRRERLLAHFNVPGFVASRTCFELNGYFGSKASYSDKSSPVHVTSYTTWFRCLVKMVRKTDDGHDGGPEYATGSKDYKWFEMSFFTRWESRGLCQVLCVDTPPDFPDQLCKLLQKQDKLDFRDPFAMHAALVDQMVVYYDISVWRVRDPVRHLEKTRMRTGTSFSPMHEISRHAIHTAEILEAATNTLNEMQRCRAVIYERLPDDPGETHKGQAKDYAQFQITLLRSLKLRSDSNQERLRNEVNLAFNNLARQDNSVMKSIALLTMIFLPATFISAIFSTTFFNYADDGSWQISDKLWIYWATTVPGTIVIVILWRIWLAHSDSIIGFSETHWKGAKIWWKRRSAPKPNKIEQA
ncbi:hypothetical protein BT67DRAFT_450775 [Trichocladium antarcticum]|uniref:Uncharacterized protein n=1 Tax=Trichocladium antarcticum TaxID=1450529 RepID=A0AAN6UHH7_9PEZI|nr:hypothetical protein BT67DRAFT_450775 [Trichocladium antarcticum]